MYQRLTAVATGALGLGLVGVTAIAQDANPPGSATRDLRPQVRQPDLRQNARTYNGVNMSRIINARITNDRGEELGTIKDIAVDSNRGRVAYAVVSPSATRGSGDQLYVVPWSTVNAAGDGTVRMVLPEDQFLSSSRFQEGDWSLLGDRTFGTELHRAYGQTPYWEGDQGITGVDRHTSPGTDIGGDRLPPPGADRGADRGTSPGTDTADNIFMRGSELRGRRIMNRQNESIGSINDMVIDANSGRVAYPIVSVGDYVGTTDDHVALPWQQIQVGAQGAMTSDLSRDRLRDAPRYDRAKPPQASDTQYVNQVYEYYGDQSHWPAEQRQRTDGQGEVRDQPQDRNQPQDRDRPQDRSPSRPGDKRP